MGDYLASLNAALSSRGIPAGGFCDLGDATERRILKEYGAVFLANSAVKIPSRFMFDNPDETDKFQSSVQSSAQIIGGTRVTLQAAAMEDLLKAVAAAKAQKQPLTISPNGPEKEASRRTYEETVRLWNDRITTGINHWKSHANRKGRKLTNDEGSKLASLSGLTQVKEVVRLEAEGFLFSTYKDKTIFASVAAPGSSQHCFMLALDVKQFGDERVRKIMANNGWFRTAFTDDPHFTYLGLKEETLPSLGLEKRSKNGAFYTPLI